MSAATLTSKGQITIPVMVRAALGVEAGDRLEFVDLGAGRFEVVAATQPVSALRGMVKALKSPVSIDDMNAVIATAGAKAR